MENWELDDVFLLISNVFEENKLNCLWKAEIDSALDQLIVSRVSYLQSSDVQVKQERDLFDIDFGENEGLTKHEIEHNLFDMELERNDGPENEIEDSGSNEDLNFNLLQKLVNISGEKGINLNEALKLANKCNEGNASTGNIESNTNIESNGSDETSSMPQDSDILVNDEKIGQPTVEENSGYKIKRKIDHTPTKHSPAYIKKNTKKELVKCKYCDKEFTTSKSAKKHETKFHVEESKKDSKKQLVKCNYCDKEFTSTKFALRHETKIHIEKSLPTCKLCCRTFKTLKYAIKHCHEVHGQLTLMTDIEPVADLEKFRKENLEDHIVDSQNGPSSRSSIPNHTAKQETYEVEEEKKELQCPVCQLPISFGPKQRGEFRKHVLNHFNKEIICPVCGKEFFSHCVMESHMRKHLNKDPRNADRMYKCAFCNWLDFSEDKLAFHQESKHEEKILLPRVFVCHCARAFSSQSILDWHVLTVHIKYHGYPEKEQKDQAKVSCEICGKFFGANGLKVHLKSHEKVSEKKDRHACKDCDKTFYSAYALKSHRMATHSKIERKCPICGKVFLNRTGFQQHVTQTHSDSKHPCNVCGKLYSFKENLRIHFRRVHQGKPAKTYKCSLCPKEFNRPSLKEKHELKH